MKSNGGHVFASSLTASNTKLTNLTRLLLEITHRGHTWHDYPWPQVSLTWLLYNLQLDDVTELISKIRCTLSANQKRDSDFNVFLINHTRSLSRFVQHLASRCRATVHVPVKTFFIILFSLLEYRLILSNLTSRFVCQVLGDFQPNFVG